MANWNEPSGSDTYSNVLTKIKNLATDAITLLSAAATNLPTGAIKYDRSNNKFQEWSGSAFVDKVIGLEGGGTGAATASGARTSLGLGTVAVLNSIGNAQITDVALAKVTGAGALAGLSSIDNAFITSVALAKVTGAGSLAAKSSIVDAYIASPIGIAKGGTGASDAGTARTNLGLGTAATQNTTAFAAPGVNADITGLSALTGVLGTHLKLDSTNLIPAAAGGANLGDATYDFNGVRCRAIAPIAGQKVQWYTSSSLATGVSANNDSAVPQFSPIGSVYLGTSAVRWETFYTTTAVDVSSDLRLKSEIEDLQNCLDKVRKLAPKSYIKNGKKELGLIAQEVFEIVPDAVSVGDEETYWGLKYEMLIPVLIAAIKELAEKMEAKE